MENQNNYTKNILFILIALLFLSFNLFGSTIELTKEEKKWLLDNPDIKLVAPINLAPFSMLNSGGKHEGILKDIFQLLSDAIGQNIQLVPVAQKKSHATTKYQGFYGLSSTLKSAKHQGNYILTKKYMTTPLFIFTKNANKNQINGKSDLQNKKIATIKSHRAGIEYLEKIGGVKMIFVNTPFEQMQKVLSGDADAMIGYITHQYLIQKYAVSDLVPAYIEHTSYGVHIGLNPEYKILQTIFNKAIDTLTLEDLNKLVAKWIILAPKTQNNTLNLTPKEKIWLQKHPKIKLASDIKFPPFESINNQGVYEGISIDYLKLIENRLGIKFIKSPNKPWTTILQMVKDQKLDMLSAAVATEQRKKYITFTKPYLSHPSVIFTQNHQTFIDGLGGLKNKTISVEKGYFSQDIIKQKYPYIQLKNYENSLLALKAVSTGEVDAYIGNITVVDYLSKKYGITNVKVSGEVPFRLDLALGVRKDLQEFIPILQKALDSITQEEENAIYKKWLSFEQKPIVDYSLVQRSALVFTVIFLIIIYWNNRLTKEIRNRKKIEHELAALNKTLEERIEKELTKNKKQQAIIFHQSRLAQMGEMLSMIAHQWRQPLNSVSIMVQSTVMKYKRETLDNTLVDKFKKDVMKQINYMSNTIDDFRDFFKPEKQQESFNIEKSIAKSISLLQPSNEGAISIDLTVTSKENIMMYGYKNEFGQAILNLLNNSRDALMQHNDTNKWIKITLSKSNNQIIITISDNGGGIKDDIIEKVFDPYFSTKFDKSGTGLGLYMTQVIIEEHLGGKIKIQNSNVGLTTFIYLTGLN